VSYVVRLTPAAQNDLKGLPDALRFRVVQKLKELADDPRQPGAVAIRSRARGTYRVRIGDYRIGYEVDDRAQTVKVWQIGSRDRFCERGTRRR